jgi:hypothetical protein
MYSLHIINYSSGVLAIPHVIDSLCLIRYKYIHQCWELEPENRPTFSSLVKSFSKFLESIAGYVDFSTIGVEQGELKLETNPVIIINEATADKD